MKSNINQGCTAKTLHNTLSDCAYLLKNYVFYHHIIVTACDYLLLVYKS